MKNNLLLALITICALTQVTNNKVEAKRGERTTWDMQDQEEESAFSSDNMKKSFVSIMVAWLKPIPIMLTIIFGGLIWQGTSKTRTSAPLRYLSRGIAKCFDKDKMEINYEKPVKEKDDEDDDESDNSSKKKKKLDDEDE